MLVKMTRLVLLILIVISFVYTLSCDSDSSSGPICLELNVSVEGQGTVDIDPEMACYEPDDLVSLTANPGSGYLFDYWESDDVIFQSNAEYLAELDITFGRGNVDITAHFAEGLDLDINIIPTGAGYVEKDPDIDAFSASDTVVLEAFENTGYEFSHWVLDGVEYTYNPLELYFGTTDVTIDAYYYTLEGEPNCYDDYDDNYNGGCNSTPEVFSDISSGDMILGTSGNFIFQDTLQYRDTDWYEITLTGTRMLDFEVVAEFPVKIFIIDGTNGCGNYFVEGVDSTIVANDTANVALTVDAGTYWMWVGPTYFTGWDCPQEYTAWFTASTTTTSTTNRERIPIDEAALSSRAR